MNDKFQFKGYDAQTIKTNVCAHDQLAGCEKDLSGPDAAATAPSSCGP